MMKRYTTPTHEIIIEGISLVDCNVYVTYKQGSNVLTFSNDDISLEEETKDETVNTIIAIHMTQDQTALFDEHGIIEVQVNWTQDGERNATDIALCKVERNLLSEVIDA